MRTEEGERAMASMPSEPSQTDSAFRKSSLASDVAQAHATADSSPLLARFQTAEHVRLAEAAQGGERTELPASATTTRGFAFPWLYGTAAILSLRNACSVWGTLRGITERTSRNIIIT